VNLTQFWRRPDERVVRRTPEGASEASHPVTTSLDFRRNPHKFYRENPSPSSLDPGLRRDDGKGEVLKKKPPP